MRGAEMDPTVSLNVRITPRVKVGMVDLSSRYGTTLRDVVEELWDRYGSSLESDWRRESREEGDG